MIEAADLVIGGAGLSGTLVALVGILTRSGLPRRWAPLSALIFGEAATFAALALGQLPDPLTAVVGGIISAAAAVGIHSGVKNTADREPENPYR